MVASGSFEFKLDHTTDITACEAMGTAMSSPQISKTPSHSLFPSIKLCFWRGSKKQPGTRLHFLARGQSIFSGVQGAAEGS
nr:uncharacterized protein LOC108177938 [Oryctolagus cuniculus]